MRIIGLAIVLFILSYNAQAASIIYDVKNINNNTWQYDYTVKNNSLSNVIEEFTIYFSIGQYSNLILFGSPADWSALVAQPDSNLNADGFLDLAALTLGITPNTSLGIFSIQFDYLGTGAPGSQSYDIVDPNTFLALETGNTILNDTASVPEPNTIYLTILGIGLLLKNKFLKKISQ